MVHLFSMRGRHIRMADAERRIFEVDARYYDAAGNQVPEEPIFHSKKRPVSDDFLVSENLSERKPGDFLEPESIEEIEWEIDDGFGKFGFKNSAGEFVIEPQYAYAHEFTCGLAAVNLNRTWYCTPEGHRYYENHYGYIDHRGKTVIPFKFDYAEPFNKYGTAIVGDSWGDTYLIDLDGNEIPGTRFPCLSKYTDYDERFVPFSNQISGNPVGIYDTKERKILLEPCLEDFFEEDEEHILIEVYDESGKEAITKRYINSRGEDIYPWLSAQSFTNIKRPNSSGIAIVTIAQYTEITDISRGFWEYKGKKCNRTLLYGLYTKEGEYLLPPEYTDISEICENIFACRKDDRIEVYFYSRAN